MLDYMLRLCRLIYTSETRRFRCLAARMPHKTSKYLNVNAAADVAAAWRWPDTVYVGTGLEKARCKMRSARWNLGNWFELSIGLQRYRKCAAKKRRRQS